MIRNSLGSLLALIGAAAVVFSPFRPWYGGRHGRDFRIDELFQGGGITGAGAALFTGLFVVMLVAAVVAVLGALTRSRTMVAVAALLSLGFTVLWMVRQGLAAGSLTMGTSGGLASGAWLALGRRSPAADRHRHDAGPPRFGGTPQQRLAPPGGGSCRPWPREEDAAPLEQPYAGTPQPYEPREPVGSRPGQASGQQPPDSAPDNTRPFPKAPPSEKPHGDEQESWPHDKRDAA